MNIVIGFKVIPYDAARVTIMNKEHCKQMFGLTSSEYHVLFDTVYRILSGEKYPDYVTQQPQVQPPNGPPLDYRLVNEHKSARENNTKISGDSLAERHFFRTGNEPERIMPMTFNVNHNHSKRNF